MPDYQIWMNENEYAFKALHIHLINASRWYPLVLLLCDVDYLSTQVKFLQKRRDRIAFERFLGDCIDAIPAEILQRKKRLVNISKQRNSFATCLEMMYCQIDSYNLHKYRDSQAICVDCGSRSMIHGHIDLPHADYHDQYFSWCQNCFWSWAKDELNSDYSFDNALWEFDYKTNMYR